MFVCIMHKKEKQVREKWKKTREHLDEKGKILYIKDEAIPLDCIMPETFVHISCFVLPG